jgi:transposase
MVRSGKSAAFKIRHANVLLAVDESAEGPGLTDAAVAEALGISTRSIERFRRRFVEEGLEACLERKKQKGWSLLRKLDGKKEARLVALACSPAPPGRKRWTLRLLADRLVVLDVVDSISHETVRQTLKKKRAETVAKEDVVHSAGAKRRVRLRHGERAGGVYAGVRSSASAGLF